LIEPPTTKPKTSKPLLIVGVILIVIGISLNVVSAVPVTDFTVLFDQTFQVPAFQYYYFTVEFYSPDETRLT